MIDRTSIRQTLMRFLQEDTAVETANITDATSIADGLGLDSVDFVGLIMRVEGQYRIRLTRPELEEIKTVGDMLTLIESKLRAPALAA